MLRWLEKALVGVGGGALAFIAIVLLNRVLVGFGFSVKQHPEVGPVVLTVAAGIVGVIGGGIGFWAADGRKHEKGAELGAATFGSIVVIYVIVATGAAFGAFERVHFNPGRLAIVGIVAVAPFVRELVSATRRSRAESE